MKVALPKKCCFGHHFFNNKFITSSFTRASELKISQSLKFSFHLLLWCEKALLQSVEVLAVTYIYSVEKWVVSDRTSEKEASSQARRLYKYFLLVF